MAQFQPVRQEMDLLGLDLAHPPDRLAKGRYPFLNNARSVQETSITSRAGYGPAINAAPFDQLNIHSIRTMNNSLPGANPASRRFVGAGTKIYSADAGVIDTGYSGNPLSLVVWRPDQSVESWLYVGDSTRMRKCRMNGATQTNYSIGIAPPVAQPGITLSAPKYTIVDDFLATTGWVAAGTAAAITSLNRQGVAATYSINFLNYDTGSTGWCNISPTSSAGNNFAWISVGARLDIGGTETSVVQETKTQVTNSFISGITYDAGATGLCTIQASCPLTGLTRNSMLRIDSGGGGDEVISVISSTEGPDGLYSFRCNCAYTHVGGGTVTLTGLPSFRVYLTLTHTTTEAITGGVGATTTGAISFTGTVGIANIYKPVTLDLSRAGGRPLNPEDYLHLSFWVDKPANLIEGRIYLNVDASDTTFASNYYYYSFRPADNTLALTGAQSSVQALQQAASNLLISEVESAIPAPSFINAANQQAEQLTVPSSQQIFSGGLSTWTEIMIPYSSLQRVGTDTNQSLSTVNEIQIWLSCSGNVTCELSSWWVGGGFGPDTFPPDAQPLCYRYRYRSSLTGAKSQQSPGTRTTLIANPDGSINGSSSGVLAYRQEVKVSAAVSSDPQVDQIDFERFGGVLNEWHYVGTLPNTGSPLFTDDFSDDDIRSNPPLETDAVLPFPSFDVPRSGICNVVGTRVTWVSGDVFVTNWAPGQEILINGIAYTVYGQPLSASQLETVQNVGVLTGVPFIVAEPVLTGQPMPFLLGPFGQGNFLLSWGDPRNPGTVRATKGLDPDSAPIEYYLELSSPSEPVVGGVIWDNNAIVFSNTRAWRIDIDANAIQSGQGNVLVKQELQVGRGLFAPWAICAGPLIWFLDEAGVPCATNGSVAESIVEEDLRPLFPHDGVPGVAVNGYLPPDLGETTELRLSYANGMVWFFYEDSGGTQRSMVYNPAKKGWLPWNYSVPMGLAYFEETESLESLLLGGTDGNLYQAGGFSDNGVTIPVEIDLPYNNSGSDRTQKFYGDAMASVDAQGVAVSLFPEFDLGATTLPALTLTGSGRTQYPLDINSGNGQLARNMAAVITWSSAIAAPVIYSYEVWGWDTGTVLRTSWASLASANGLPGWQHARDGYLPLLMPVPGTVQLQMIVDGVAQAAIPFTPAVANQLQKMRVDFTANKGKLFQFRILPGPPFLLFEKDLEINMKSWGSTGPYVNVRPLGDGVAG